MQMMRMGTGGLSVMVMAALLSLLVLVVVVMPLPGHAKSVLLQSHAQSHAHAQSQDVNEINDATVDMPMAVASQADCLLRLMTQDAAANLEPDDFVGSDWSVEAASALRLKDLCKTTESSSASSSSLPPAQNTKKSKPSVTTANCDAFYFVDATAGSDGNNGTIEAPFASLYHALGVSRDRQGGAIRSPCIYLRAGTHYLGELPPPTAGQPNDSQFGYIDLTAIDSGLTISAYNGENVILSGGSRIKPNWQPYKTLADGVIYSTHVPSTLLMTDPLHFNELYVNGTRAIRAKWPNGDPATHGMFSVDTGYDTAGNVSWISPSTTPTALIQNFTSPLLPDRVFSQYLMGYGGAASPFTPPRSFWALPDPQGGLASTFTLPLGFTYDADTAFAPRANAWKKPTTGFVHAFHQYWWANWIFSIASVDPTSSTLQFGPGGFQDGRGAPAGASAFYVENVFEELDAPNEWFYDASTSTLYLMTNGTSTQPPSTGDIVLSQLPCLISAHGSAAQPVSNVLLTGLTFAHTSNTMMRNFEVVSGGDWSLHRGGAIFLTGTENVVVQDSVFTQLGGTAVVISDWNLNAQVTRCEFVWGCDSGVVVVGSAPDVNTFDYANQPTQTQITSNLFHELGIYIKQSAPVFIGLARSTTVSNNAMFNVPRAGININDGFYGNHSLVQNVIFNTVRETADHGPINTWDRLPYLTAQWNATTGQVEPSLLPAKSYITQNLLFCAYSSAWPIDHDDGSQQYEDSRNVLVYGGYKSNLGNSKTTHESLYIFPDGQRFDEANEVLRVAAKEAMVTRYRAGAAKKQEKDAVENGGVQDPGLGQYCASLYRSEVNLTSWGEEFYNNTCVLQSSDQPYDFENCVLGAPVIPYLANNLMYTTTSEVTIGCALANGTSVNLSLAEFQAAGYDNGSTVASPPSVESLVSIALNMLYA